MTFLAEDGGQPVGFLLGRPKSERIGYVSDLYVLPEERRRGVARRLLTEGIAALGREVVTLDVDASNAGALAFYRRARLPRAVAQARGRCGAPHVIRRATTADRETLHELYRAFFAEQPPPEYYGVSIEHELTEVDEIVGDGLAFVADEDGAIAGFALARRKEGTRGVLSDIYVRPEARRKGLATALTAAVTDALAESGVTHVTLSVDPQNAAARAAYASWGFREQELHARRRDRRARASSGSPRPRQARASGRSTSRPTTPAE